MGTQFLRRLLALAILAPAGVLHAQQRPFSVSAMVRTQEIGEARFGPRGRHLLIEKLLAYDHSSTFRWRFVFNRDRTRLLDVDLSGGIRVAPVTNGSYPGVWFRSYSPNGGHAAIGWFDGNVEKAGVYDFSTGEFRKFRYPISSVACAFECPFWISENEFIDYTVPAGVQEREMDPILYEHKLINTWDSDTWAGRQVTPTVYCSGGACGTKAFERGGKLILVNARSGNFRVLADDVMGVWWAFGRLSPGRQRFAFLSKSGTFSLGDMKKNAADVETERYRLVVYEVLRGGDAVLPCNSCNVTPDSLRWSPNGDKLFFDATEPLNGKEVHRQYIFNFRTSKLWRFLADGLPFRVSNNPLWGGQIVPFVWLDDTTPAVFVHKIVTSTISGAQAAQRSNIQLPEGGRVHYAWYALPPGHAPVNLTAGLAGGEKAGGLDDFIAVHKGAMLMIVNGSLWRLEANGSRKNLTRAIHGRLAPWCQMIAYWRSGGDVSRWPNCGGVPGLRDNAVIHPPQMESLRRGWVTLRFLRNGVPNGDLLFFNVDNGYAARLQTPAFGAEVISASALSRSALYDSEGSDGDRLLLASIDRRPVEVLRFNQQLKGVVGARRVMLVRREAGEHRSETDWLLLPPGFSPGDRKPLLVYFYPGYQYTRAARGPDFRSVSFDNMEIPAAHGYAVLLASTRLPAAGEPGDPCDEVERQLIDAAEDAVREGYADAAHWALMGHSYGGYGVLCVIAHTTRFKAAIDLSGPANLTSAYGEAGFPNPAGNPAVSIADLASGTGWAESGQGRMGVPPWVDSVRYVENSPLFSANKIETPLLIFHGNDDWVVDVGESEQMFNALHRLGRPAEFVRYWGEGHVYLSPGTMRDMWRRIFGWLDRYLDVSRDTYGRITFGGSRVNGKAPQ